VLRLRVWPNGRWIADCRARGIGPVYALPWLTFPGVKSQTPSSWSWNCTTMAPDGWMFRSRWIPQTITRFWVGWASRSSTSPRMVPSRWGHSTGFDPCRPARIRWPGPSVRWTPRSTRIAFPWRRTRPCTNSCRHLVPRNSSAPWNAGQEQGCFSAFPQPTNSLRLVKSCKPGEFRYQWSNGLLFLNQSPTMRCPCGSSLMYCPNPSCRLSRSKSSSTKARQIWFLACLMPSGCRARCWKRCLMRRSRKPSCAIWCWLPE